MYQIPYTRSYNDYGNYDDFAFNRIIKEGEYYAVSLVDIEFSDGTTAQITDEDMLGGRIRIHMSVGNNNAFSFGSICAKRCEFTIRNTSVLGAKDWAGAKLTVQCGIKKRINTWQDHPTYSPEWVNYEKYVPMGVYYVDEIEKPQETITVKAMDGIQFLDKQIADSPTLMVNRNYIDTAAFTREVEALVRVDANKTYYKNTVQQYVTTGNLYVYPPKNMSMTYREFLSENLASFGQCLYIDGQNRLIRADMALPYIWTGAEGTPTPRISLEIKPSNRYSYTPNYYRRLNAFAFKSKATMTIMGEQNFFALYGNTTLPDDLDKRAILKLDVNEETAEEISTYQTSNLISRLPRYKDGSAVRASSGWVLPFECEYLGDPRIELFDLVKIYPEEKEYTEYSEELGYGFVMGIDYTNGESQFLYSGDIKDDLVSYNELIPEVKGTTERPLTGTTYYAIHNYLSGITQASAQSSIISYSIYYAGIYNLVYNPTTRILTFFVRVWYQSSSASRAYDWKMFVNLDACEKTLDNGVYTLTLNGDDTSNYGQVLCLSDNGESLQGFSEYISDLDKLESIKITCKPNESNGLYIALKYTGSGLLNGRDIQIWLN